MKARTCVLCVACISIGMALSGIPQSRSTGEEKPGKPERIKWEYTTEHNPSDGRLNELGRDGWELVAVASKGSGDRDAMCYLKRPAP